ncbi:MAG: S8 family serine peptidase [Thermodesulfobacteriota bacterium]|nr:S8 family serine peptidase [Thermodesulfobacteriota bacterium]
MKKLVILILLFICFLSDHILAFEPDSGERPSYAPGELLVKYKGSVHAAATQYYRTQWDINALRTFRVTGVQNVKLPRWMTIQAALEIYQDDPDVEYAEPNYYRYTCAIPDDTDFDLLWGLHNTGQYVNGIIDADIDAPEAWDITTGNSDIVIAIVDTGVDYSHPDLSDNMWSNTGETPDNGIDDDGNGYVDDVRGWDFFGNDKDTMDLHGHGTHVTGIAAAEGDNAIGITGVCWTARIMPLRFLDAGGYGTVADDEINGLLVPVKDAPALAQAMERMINDPKMRKRMGKAGRKKVEREFDEKIVTQKILKTYDAGAECLH